MKTEGMACELMRLPVGHSISSNFDAFLAEKTHGFLRLLSIGLKLMDDSKCLLKIDRFHSKALLFTSFEVQEHFPFPFPTHLRGSFLDTAFNL